MIFSPLFWIYLFLLCNLFIYLTNRVSFHPRYGFSENKWINSWTAFFLLAFGVPTILLIQAWDFSLATWSSLPEPLRIFSAGMSLVSAWVLSKHFFWARFIRKNADTRLISRRYPNRPARWPLPYAWLGKVGMHNQLHDLEVNE